MPQKLTRKDYKKMSRSLSWLEPFDECCGSAFLDAVHIEPVTINGNRDRQRTCIVECQYCGQRYVTRWT
jgi:hypothetical protein